MKEKFYAIGVGPGDPKLMTLRAVELLKSCNVIGIPSASKEECIAYKIARQAVPEISAKEVISVVVPMTKNQDVLKTAYELGTAKIEEVLMNGRSVGFLNLGDPMLYGSVQTICELLEEQGYETEVVSGVSSISAVAGHIGIPLAVREEGLHIMPSNYELSETDIIEYLQKKDSIVLMKASSQMKHVKELCGSLEAKGLAICYAITDCGMETEIRWNDINEIDDRAGYFTTILIKPC